MELDTVNKDKIAFSGYEALSGNFYFLIVEFADVVAGTFTATNYASVLGMNDAYVLG